MELNRGYIVGVVELVIKFGMGKVIETVVGIEEAAVNRARRFMVVVFVVLNVDGHVAHNRVGNSSRGGHGVVTRVILIGGLLRAHMVSSHNAILLRLNCLIPDRHAADVASVILVGGEFGVNNMVAGHKAVLLGLGSLIPDWHAAHITSVVLVWGQLGVNDVMGSHEAILLLLRSLVPDRHGANVTSVVLIRSQFSVNDVMSGHKAISLRLTLVAVLLSGLVPDGHAAHVTGVILVGGELGVDDVVGGHEAVLLGLLGGLVVVAGVVVRDRASEGRADGVLMPVAWRDAVVHVVGVVHGVAQVVQRLLVVLSLHVGVVREVLASEVLIGGSLGADHVVGLVAVDALVGESVRRRNGGEDKVLMEFNGGDIMSIIELVVELAMRQMVESIVRVKKTAVNGTRRLVVVILVVLNVDRHVAHNAVRHASWGGHGVIARVVLIGGLLRADVVGCHNAVLLRLHSLIIEAFVGESVVRWDCSENSVLVELNGGDVVGVIEFVIELTVREVIEAVVRVEKTAINRARRFVVVVLMVLNIDGHVAHDWMRNSSRSCHGVIARVVLVGSLFGTNMVGSHDAVLLRLYCLVVEALIRESVVRWHSSENSMLMELDWGNVMGIVKLVVKLTVRQMVEAVIRVEKTAVDGTRRLVVVVFMVLNIHRHVAHDWMRNSSRSGHGMISRVILVSSLLRANMMGSNYTILLLLRLSCLVVVGCIVRSHALVRESVRRAHSWEDSRVMVRNGSDIMSVVVVMIELWVSVVIGRVVHVVAVQRDLIALLALVGVVVSLIVRSHALVRKSVG